MNRVFTLLFVASCLTAVGQVTYPYNPDGNADTLIGVTDLQDLLTTYGQPFLPTEILVEGQTLTTVLTDLRQSIDSLESLVGLKCVELRGNQSENQGYPNPMFFDLTADVGLVLVRTDLNGHAKIRLPQSAVEFGQQVTLMVSGSITPGMSSRSWNLQTIVEGEWANLAGWFKGNQYNHGCYPFDCAGEGIYIVRVEYSQEGWIPSEMSPEIFYWSEE